MIIYHYDILDDFEVRVIIINEFRVLPMLRKTFLGADFLLGALAPSLIYLVLAQKSEPFAGAISASLWACGVLLINYIRRRELNYIALFSLLLAGITLCGILLTGIPELYLYAPLFTDLLTGSSFFISLFMRRSLLQVLAESMHFTDDLPEHIKSAPEYRIAWQRLTIVWGCKDILDLLIKAYALFNMPLAIYLVALPIYKHLSFLFLMAFSFWFPRWFWQRKLQIN